MPRTIFLSWQHDTDPSCGHYFLRDVLKEVCAQIKADTSLEEAERDVEPDMDTQGVRGHTFVVPTILKKIDEASVFVADVTYTGTVAKGTKFTPNPNVLLEFGWAWKGKQEKIVSVMNKAHGFPPNSPLPFDLGFARWPTFFNLPDGANKAERDAELKRFAPILKAIVLDLLREPESTEQFPQLAPKQGIARFRGDSESIGMTWDPDAPMPVQPQKEVFLAKGPALFMRLSPTKPLKATLAHPTMAFASVETGRLSLRPIYCGAIVTLRAEDGIAICGAVNGDGRTSSVAFAFEHGEVWAVDTTLLEAWRGENTIHIDAVTKTLSEVLAAHRDFLVRLGIPGPYRWEVGFEGIRNRRLVTARNGSMTLSGHPFLSNELRASGAFQFEQTPEDALKPLVDEMFKKGALPRP